MHTRELGSEVLGPSSFWVFYLFKRRKQTASRHARPASNDPAHNTMHPSDDVCFICHGEDPGAKSWPPPTRAPCTRCTVVAALDTPQLATIYLICKT
jgi:hypothetical protein